MQNKNNRLEKKLVLCVALPVSRRRFSLPPYQVKGCVYEKAMLRAPRDEGLQKRLSAPSKKKHTWSVCRLIRVLLNAILSGFYMSRVWAYPRDLPSPGRKHTLFEGIVSRGTWIKRSQRRSETSEGSSNIGSRSQGSPELVAGST